MMNIHYLQMLLDRLGDFPAISAFVYKYSKCLPQRRIMILLIIQISTSTPYFMKIFRTIYAVEYIPSR